MESYLVFVTEKERFALPANIVDEVLEAPNVRRLAGMPPHVAGVVLHRGTWLPAIDAAARLGLEPRSGRAAALVVRRGRGRFALTADAVLGIREWADTGDMGIATTDYGLVTPVDPNLLFRNEMAGRLQIAAGLGERPRWAHFYPSVRALVAKVVKCHEWR
jgi:hypothetical protein